MRLSNGHFALAALLVCLASGAPGYAGALQQSTLTQSIEPITCIYTITVTGEATSSSTDCDSVIAPTLEVIEPRAGRPRLCGTLTSADAKIFRVWVGGVWFTYGASSYLTVDSDSWEMDLVSMINPLEPGEYSIVLEELTVSDFFLRSVYPDALKISVVDLVRTDTVVGDGVTSHYVANSPGNLITSHSVRYLLPDDRLVDTSSGFTHYIYDNVELDKMTPTQIIRYTLLFILILVVVYRLYARLQKNKPDK